MRRAVIPAGMRDAADDPAFSPAIRSGDHLFLTGMTGSGADGTMPDRLDAQLDAALDKIAAVLDAAGATLDAVVEMTSYHLALRAHFGACEDVLRDRFSPPRPAWTAVEVAGLRRPGALVEIRAVARIAAA